MRIRVLGSAAGGGFPQWNCNCANCRRARAREPGVLPRSQAGLAVSAEPRQWVLLNASPDLRQQLLASPEFAPDGGVRGTQIRAVVLTNGDIDAIAGLLSLRESQRFALYATDPILRSLAENPVFKVLNADLVPRRPLRLDRTTAIEDADGTATGLRLTPFAVPGKVALYLEEAGGVGPRLGEETIGLEVRDGLSRFFFLPSCADLPADLAARLQHAPVLFFDGSFWDDDEMIRAGLGEKTARRMGHMPMSGEDGSLARLAPLGIARKLFIHINNSNPILLPDSAERAAAAAAGWEVASDGMEVVL